MKLAITKPQLIRIIVLVAVTGAVAAFVSAQDSTESVASVAEAKPKVVAAAPSASGKPIASFDIAALARPSSTAIQDDLFYIPPPPKPPPQPVAPPPPPVVEAPPPKPTPPPLPFTYIGKLIDGGTTKVFVLHQDKRLILKQGDTAADVYRVEHIGEKELVFIYEPLAEKQVLAMGAAR